MTVKELRELLKESTDDMQVYIMDNTVLGSFSFMPVCGGVSGVMETGTTTIGFVIAPFGIVASDGDEDLDINLN